jgi:simple sugar transport system permease protein
VAALFGQLHPLGAIPASFLFGALLVGANKIQRIVQVPTALVTTLNGLVVIFVVSADLWRRRSVHLRDLQTASAEKTAMPPAPPVAPIVTKESP